MYMDTPDFLSISLHTITVVATPLHILGTYCILFQTPKSMSSVKWVMLNFHCWCMLVDWSITILTVPFLFFPAMAGFPLGILVELGVGIGVQVNLILMGVVALEAALLQIFENRYFIIFASKTKWRYYRKVFIVFNYFVSATIFVPALIAVPDQKVGLEHIYKNFPQIPFHLYDISPFVYAIDYFWAAVPLVVYLVFNVLQFYSLLTILSRCLKSTTRALATSPNTLNLQRKFLNSIYIQAGVVLMNLQIPVVYVAISLFSGYYNQTANNLVFILLALHGISSTAVMIAAHKPYRQFCGGLIGLMKKRIMRRPTASVVIVSNQS